MKVPFLDLKAQYDSIQQEIDPAIQRVIHECAFAGGPHVESFEMEFARFCGCKHAVALNSGTTALWAAMSGLGLGPGDEVITVPNTFVATVEAIVFTGATPVLVDVVQGTWTMDPSQLEKAITPKTRAIVPVHLYGRTADMDPILEISKANDLLVVEDAAQAHGSQYKGRLAGSMGDAGCFSFYPGKNLGAYGEGGTVVTNDDQLAEYMRKWRDHGQCKKYYHDIVGWNARMDGIQGAVLSTKLRYLNQWNEARRQNAAIYEEFLGGVDGIETPGAAPCPGHVYHLYVIQCEERDQLMKFLAQQGISCGIHYPIPVHLQEAFRGLGLQAGDFPISETSARRALSLPMYPELKREQIEQVCDAIKTFVTMQRSEQRTESV